MVFPGVLAFHVFGSAGLSIINISVMSALADVADEDQAASEKHRDQCGRDRAFRSGLLVSPIARVARSGIDPGQHRLDRRGDDFGETHHHLPGELFVCR